MSGNYRDIISAQRGVLKAYGDDREDFQSPQRSGAPMPELFPRRGCSVTQLTRDFSSLGLSKDLLSAINGRRSHRRYTEQPLTLEELSFLLWCTQGVRGMVGDPPKASMRTVPSAGARHPLETYLAVSNVAGLGQGLYHYLPDSHAVEYLGEIADMAAAITAAAGDQPFCAAAPVFFVWAAKPARCEWKYTIMAQKYILIDAGHACQNLYLACEAIGCGTCGIGAYKQECMDALLRLTDTSCGSDDPEFAVYAAPVGHVPD